MRAKFTVAVTTALLQVVALATEECRPPPVASSEQALCFAGKFIKQQPPVPWEVKFNVKESDLQWLVSYHPVSSEVRGGAGDLRIDKASGRVTVVQVYR
jgi:hypothetical protein